MLIEPANSDLNDIVQYLERDRLGKSRPHQISGSVSSSSIRVVRLWLKLAAAAMSFGGPYSGSCRQLGSLLHAVPGQQVIDLGCRVVGNTAQCVGQPGAGGGGGSPFSLAVTISVYITAVRSPPRSKPANRGFR